MSNVIQMGIVTDNNTLNLLSKGLYQNPEQTIMRELISNAISASQPKDAPIQVKMTEQELSVQDFGSGMSLETVVNVFANFLATTKSDDVNTIGGFGLGVKSIFTYSNQFLVETTSPEDGIRRTFFFQNKTGEIPTYEYMAHCDVHQSEIKGTKISFPIVNDYQQINRFIDGCKQMMLSPHPIVFDTPLPIQKISESDADFLKTNGFLFCQQKINFSTDRETYPFKNMFDFFQNDFKVNVNLGGVLYPFVFEKNGIPYVTKILKESEIKLINQALELFLIDQILMNPEKEFQEPNRKLSQEDFALVLNVPPKFLQTNTSRENIIISSENKAVLMEYLKETLTSYISKKKVEISETISKWDKNFENYLKMSFIYSMSHFLIHEKRTSEFKAVLSDFVSYVKQLTYHGLVANQYEKGSHFVYPNNETKDTAIKNANQNRTLNYTACLNLEKMSLNHALDSFKQAVHVVWFKTDIASVKKAKLNQFLSEMKRNDKQTIVFVGLETPPIPYHTCLEDWQPNHDKKTDKAVFFSGQAGFVYSGSNQIVMPKSLHLIPEFKTDYYLLCCLHNKGKSQYFNKQQSNLKTHFSALERTYQVVYIEEEQYVEWVKQAKIEPFYQHFAKLNLVPFVQYLKNGEHLDLIQGYVKHLLRDYVDLIGKDNLDCYAKMVNQYLVASDEYNQKINDFIQHAQAKGSILHGYKMYQPYITETRLALNLLSLKPNSNISVINDTMKQDKALHFLLGYDLFEKLNVPHYTVNPVFNWCLHSLTSSPA